MQIHSFELGITQEDKYLFMEKTNEFYAKLIVKSVLAGTPFASGIAQFWSEIEAKNFEEKVEHITTQILIEIKNNDIEINTTKNDLDFISEIVKLYFDTEKVTKHKKLIKIASSYLCSECKSKEIIIHRHLLKIISEFTELHYLALLPFRSKKQQKFELIVSQLPIDIKNRKDLEITWLLFYELENCILLKKHISFDTELKEILTSKNSIIGELQNSVFELTAIGEYFINLIGDEI